MKETEANVRAYCIGTGIVTQSLGFRFLLSAIFVVKPLACSYEVCGSFDKALGFIRHVSASRGLKLPDRVTCPWPELAS